MSLSICGMLAWASPSAPSSPAVGADRLLLGLAQVGAPLQGRRRQSGRHRRHHRLLVHRLPAWDRPRRSSEQDADLILLGGDVTLDLRDVGLGIAERAL